MCGKATSIWIIAGAFLISSLLCQPLLADEYVDPQKRFTVVPPEGWEVMVADDGSGLASFTSPDGEASLIILPAKVSDSASLDSLPESYEMMLKGAQEGILLRTLGEKRLEIADHQALQKEYKISSTDGKTAMALATYIKVGELSLTLAATISEGGFDNIAPLVEASIKTLRFPVADRDLKMIAPMPYAKVEVGKTAKIADDAQKLKVLDEALREGIISIDEYRIKKGDLVLTRQKNRIVMVSHIGEITSDSRYAGDMVKYRIYYVNTSKSKATITITSRLDSNLKNVSVLNSGSYNRRQHAVGWEAKNVAAGKEGFVEFEATVGGTGKIETGAEIKLNGGKPVITNIAVVRMIPKPTLGWIAFDKTSKSGTVPRSYMKDETTMGTMVNFDIPGAFVREIKVQGTTYQRLSIPRYTTLLELGKPDLPIVGQIVEIPHGIGISLEIYKSEYVTYDGYNVFPAQERQIRQVESRIKKLAPSSTMVLDAIKRPELTLVPVEGKGFMADKSTYQKNAFYPGQLAAVAAEDVGIIRGHRVVFIKANPIQYNPVTKQIRAYSRIEVRLKYDHPAQIQGISRRIESAPFEEMLEASILNYKNLDRFGDRGDVRDDDDDQKSGCDYLILTHGDFYNASDVNNPLVRFQDWKQRKGYVTSIVDIDNIPGGSAAEDIRDYIQDAYDTWQIVPSYVLLVGDANLIPTNYQTAHSSHNNTLVGTDIYYVTVDGDDYFPDMFVGRLSVDTSPQLVDVIDKILDYERSAPNNAGYYNDTPLVCLYEDDTDAMPPGQVDGCPEDGTEDCTFRIIEFAEEIWTYLDADYNPDRIYNRSSAATDPAEYEDGTDIPIHLEIANGFQWDGDTNDIRNAINNGSFLVTFNGHGGTQSWGNPRFVTANVTGLTNGSLTPVVFSFACKTGWFDHETDDASLATTTTSESLCEEFLRHSNGGAVAIIGATRNSTDHNDFMMLGAYKALWPDFDPDPPLSPGSLPDIEMAAPLQRMGQIMSFSKVYMARRYNHDIDRQLSFEMYHVFGDPEMPVWTERPAALTVSHPDGIGSTGQQDFVVMVTDSGGDPVYNATVVLTRGNSILKVDQTNPGGYVLFTLNSPASGSIDITVTALNYRPYEGNIIVSGGGAVINRLDPDNGMAGQTIYIGVQNFSGSEAVEVIFDGTNVLTKNASGGSFGQSGVEDVDFDVPSPHDIEPVNVVAHSSSDRYAADVFWVRSANPIDLYTYCQWSNDTWHLQPGDNPVWNNPEIQLYEGATAVESNNLSAGHTYTIKAKIHNDTNFDADSVTVTFKWANFGLGQSERVWDEIGTHVLDVPKLSVVEAQTTWTPVGTGHLCVLATIYHAEDINEANNKGQENCHVGPTSSPAVVPFRIYNPTKDPVAVHLELRQIMKGGKSQKEQIWATWVDHPDPQMIPPEGMTEARVIIDPDVGADIRKGESAEFSLTGFIDDIMIGGVHFIIYKK